MARRRRKSDEAPGWVWMLFGLGIGLVVALGVYINGQPASSEAAVAPVVRQQQNTAVVAEESTPAPQPAAADSSPTDSESGSITVEARAGEDPDRFGFYELLPNFEVVIPEVETPAPRAQSVVAIADPGTYVLQAGSFLTEADAEGQRARLALLGIESRLQRVAIDDRTFHRVLVGPIENLDELNSIRARLFGDGIESMVMRITQ